MPFETNVESDREIDVWDDTGLIDGSIGNNEELATNSGLDLDQTPWEIIPWVIPHPYEERMAQWRNLVIALVCLACFFFSILIFAFIISFINEKLSPSEIRFLPPIYPRRL